VIDVERLMILREVARHGSKAGAARALRLSEPTVAHHLAALERGAGVALTMRAGRVTRLTPAGEALVEHADAIAASLDSAERALHHHADLQVGRLRIASFQSFCAGELAAPLAQFSRDYPGIEVGLIEAETDDSLGLLNAGEADLVVGFADDATPAPPDQPITPLARDEYLLVLPAHHPLARGRSVRFGDLASERWISGCERCRNHLVALASDAGFTPEIAFLTEDYVTVLKLVAEQLGVAILPKMALDASPQVPGTVTVRTKPRSHRDVFIALPPQPSPAARTFAGLLAPASGRTLKP
jgi:molybdate transport repressor ModE-like protein